MTTGCDVVWYWFWTYLYIAGEENLHAVRELESGHVGVGDEGCSGVESIVRTRPKMHQLHAPSNGNTKKHTIILDSTCDSSFYLSYIISPFHF